MTPLNRWQYLACQLLPDGDLDLRSRLWIGFFAALCCSCTVSTDDDESHASSADLSACGRSLRPAYVIGSGTQPLETAFPLYLTARYEHVFLNDRIVVNSALVEHGYEFLCGPVFKETPTRANALDLCRAVPTYPKSQLHFVGGKSADKLADQPLSNADVFVMQPTAAWAHHGLEAALLSLLGPGSVAYIAHDPGSRSQQAIESWSGVDVKVLPHEGATGEIRIETGVTYWPYWNVPAADGPVPVFSLHFASRGARVYEIRPRGVVSP